MTELLVAKHDGRVAVRVALADRLKLTIGRSHRCDLRLNAGAVSRRHALLFHHDGQWHLVDTGSRTGIFRDLEKVWHVTLAGDRWARVGPAYLWLREDRDLVGLGPDTPPPTGRSGPRPVDGEPLPSLDDHGSADEMHAARLVVIDAAGSSMQRFGLDGRELVTVGRSPRCDVVLQDQQVSRLHCVLYTEHRGWCVADAGSGSGTRVEGSTTRRRVLEPERLVRVGASLLWLDPMRTAEDKGMEQWPVVTAESAFFDDLNDRTEDDPAPGDHAPSTPFGAR